MTSVNSSRHSFGSVRYKDHSLMDAAFTFLAFSTFSHFCTSTNNCRNKYIQKCIGFQECEFKRVTPQHTREWGSNLPT